MISCFGRYVKSFGFSALLFFSDTSRHLYYKRNETSPEVSFGSSVYTQKLYPSAHRHFPCAAIQCAGQTAALGAGVMRDSAMSSKTHDNAHPRILELLQSLTAQKDICYNISTFRNGTVNKSLHLACLSMQMLRWSPLRSVLDVCRWHTAPSVDDARIASFFRLAFAYSSCANCKVIYEQFLRIMVRRKYSCRGSRRAFPALKGGDMDWLDRFTI